MIPSGSQPRPYTRVSKRRHTFATSAARAATRGEPASVLPMKATSDTKRGARARDGTMRLGIAGLGQELRAAHARRQEVRDLPGCDREQQVDTPGERQRLALERQAPAVRREEGRALAPGHRLEGLGQHVVRVDQHQLGPEARQPAQRQGVRCTPPEQARAFAFVHPPELVSLALERPRDVGRRAGVTLALPEEGDAHARGAQRITK